MEDFRAKIAEINKKKLAKNVMIAVSFATPKKYMLIAINWKVVLSLAIKVTFAA